MRRAINLTLLICLGCLATFKSYSQNIHLGMTTAVNATFVLDKGLSKDPRYNSTYTYKWAPIGFNFGADLGRKFGLSLESILAKQGQVYQMVNAAKQIQGERKIDMSILQLPLLMKFMSGGNGGARANFNLGPQMNIIRTAVESVQANAGDYKMPEGATIETIKQEFPNAVQKDASTYTLPSNVPSKDLFTKKANDFKNSEFSIAGSFGLDIDLSKHLYLTTQIRATYSLTDVRNGDLIDQLKAGNNIFSNRANLLVGMQIGLHYSLRTTRSFKVKG